MSFYNARGDGVFPGLVNGNPTTGLRHRVAVCVERVLDSCMKQDTAEDTKLHLSIRHCARNAHSDSEQARSNPDPKSTPSPLPEKPYKFISAGSFQSAAQVTDLVVTRLSERPEFARVKCTVTIPMHVTVEDSKGERLTFDSCMSVAQDVILFVPKNSIFPFEVKAVAAVNCTSGKMSGEHTCIVTACYTIITKVVASTDLLIPTYGFCPSPKAVDFSKEECNDFFDLPLYPSGR